MCETRMRMWNILGTRPGLALLWRLRVQKPPHRDPLLFRSPVYGLRVYSLCRACLHPKRMSSRARTRVCVVLPWGWALLAQRRATNSRVRENGTRAIAMRVFFVVVVASRRDKSIVKRLAPGACVTSGLPERDTNSHTHARTRAQWFWK